SSATLDPAGQASLAVRANGNPGRGYALLARASGAPSVKFSLSNLPALILNPVTLANGTFGSSYSQRLTATGGAGGPYSFAVTGPTLLGGLILTTDGLLTGTATATGTFTLTVQVTDSGGFTANRSYMVTFDPAVLTVKADDAARTYGGANPAF